MKLGRFDLEDSGYTVRVQVTDPVYSALAPLVCWLSLLAGAVVCFALGSDTVRWMIIAVAPSVISIAGYVAGGASGVQRSTYPRVRRFVEASWKGHPNDVSGSRAHDAPLIWNVDGARFADKESLGFVVAVSMEASLPLPRARLVQRSITTLVFRRALYELGAVDGFGNATHEATELGEQIAAAIAGKKVKVPIVHWSPSSFRMTQFVVAVEAVVPMLAALFIGNATHWSSSVASAIFLGSVVLNIASTIAISVVTERARSHAGEGLLANAAAALGEHHRAAEPFR